MKPAAFSPRSLFIAAVMMIVILSVAAWLLWWAAAAQYRAVIDGWIAAGRAAGYQISYDHRQVFGFPRYITMRLSNLHWRNADAIDFHADSMDIQVTPWDWHHYRASFKGHVALTAPTDENGHALIMAGDAGRAQVTLTTDGTWQKAQIALTNAAAGLTPHYLFKIGSIDAAVARPDAPPATHTQVGLTLTGAADSITLPAAMPSPFGDQAHKMTVSMRVMGRVPDVREKAAVAAWNNDSGVVQFDDLSIDWGALKVNAKGTMGFDDDLQPEGAFAGIIADPAQTTQSLIKAGFIASRDADMLAAAMDLFAKPSGANKGAGMQLPITVQLGGLFLGPVRIFTFPEIEWPPQPPSSTATSARSGCAGHKAECRRF